MSKFSEILRGVVSSLLQHARSVYYLLSKKLLLDRWFPHVPLALALGLVGILQLLPVIERLLGVSLINREISAVLGFNPLAVRGLPQGFVGFFMVVMSIGLVLRSRLAWIMAIITTLASIGLTLAGPETDIFSVPIIYNVVLFVLLVLSSKSFYRASLATGTLYALTSAVILFTYAVLGSYSLGASFSPEINDFSSALYFAVVTMSTVGYGDILPLTPQARLFVISIVIAGITLFATSLSAVLVPVISKRMRRLLEPREVEMKHVNHYIIIGDTVLARNSYREFRSRKIDVTFILNRAPEEGVFEQAEVIVGDATDVGTLKRAGVQKSRAVLALSDDDSENAFVILAVKEAGSSAKTVAAVNDSRNMSRIRMVQPDMVIAPQVLGGELLAMALSGETIDSESFMDRFLHFK